MSSYGRKGCFKCGNIGHVAANCESVTRLCYNCRSPEHESNECPSPRTTEAKQCYHCGGVGHIVSACPSQPARGPGGPGGFRGGFQGGSRGGFAGGAPGSFQGGFRRPVNPAGFGQKCYRCQGTGHLQINCPTPATSFARGPKTCYKCSTVGHIAKDCPSAESAPAAANTSDAVHVSQDTIVPAAAEIHA
ncbi:E3 ubiquitin ligase interacting with arginine methyltransferase [Phaffia rhodozyma]|uniref:E3 ubiquitin ligase interacting with arginine methyltransferase n=1 Tax=Phaffia rhodozyma TaxID=264483 RepID=A0A0F7SLA5_PHARH|nr:E3 ubiquitin ligase interacting with arginine methyltransferase [Phaffia rhodozyma]